MSLNKFSDAQKGYDLKLSGGFDEIKANNIETTNLNTSTINSAPVNQSARVILVQENEMPTSYESNTTYVFVGSRTTATPLNLSAYENICFRGQNRVNCEIIYSGNGAFITTENKNFTLQGLKLKQTATDGYLLDAKNWDGTPPSRTNILTIEDCEIRDCYNVFLIEGYDLVDINQTIFTRIRGGSTLLTSYGVYTKNVSKLEFNSCELIRWVDTGGTSYFNGDMLHIEGSNGASFVSNNVIHPQDDVADPANIQNGVFLEGVATFVECLINNNAFVDINLNNGVLIQTNSNTAFNRVGIQEGNSLTPNLRSFIMGQLSGINTQPTTELKDVPADIDFDNKFITINSNGVSVDTQGVITYTRKRPVNFQININANLIANSGGASQRVGLTLAFERNMVKTQTGVVSYVNLTSGGSGDPLTCSLSLIGSAQEGDKFYIQLVNTSVALDVICQDINIAGIEI